MYDRLLDVCCRGDGMMKKQIPRKVCSLLLALVIAFGGQTAEFAAQWAVPLEAYAENIDISSDGYPEYSVLAEGLQATIDDIADSAEQGAAAEARITLGGDYGENISVPDNMNLVLDLNGHKVNSVSDISNAAGITVFGTLKLVDSAGGGAFVSEGVSDLRAADIVSGGKLIFEGGALRGYSFSGSGGGIMVEDGGYLNMTGGSIENCSSDQMGGGLFVYNAQDVNFEGGKVSQCSAVNGGGLYVYRSSVDDENTRISLSGVEFSENTASQYGGGVYFDSSVSADLHGAAVYKNTAATGGGIYFSHTAKLTVEGDASVSENSADLGGGIFFNTINTEKGSEFTLNGGSISRNRSENNGGGVCFPSNIIPAAPSMNTVTINAGEIIGNEAARYGGGIYLDKKVRLTIGGGSIEGNKANYYGGGIFIQDGSSQVVSEVAITGGSVSENTFDGATTTPCGAGMYIGSWSRVDISGGSFDRNTKAYEGGGAFFGSYSRVRISGSASFCGNVLSNSAGYVYGGGIFMSGGSQANRAQLEITGGKFNENDATNRPRYGNGGAMYVGYWCDTTIRDCEICSNRSYGSGGGIMTYSSTIIEGDTLITDNSTTGNGYGGGICANDTLVVGGNTKINRNSSGSQGGGIEVVTDSIGASGYSFEIRDNVQINENESSSGGGVYAGIHYQPGTYTPFRMRMTGGEISGNKATSSGGGLFLKNCEPNFLTGGSITNNQSGGSGGGVCFVRRTRVENGNHVSFPTLTVSQDFEISGNKAANNGGGIYSEYGARVVLSEGASIINNTASYGGGIYIYPNSWHDFGNGEDETLEIAAGTLKLNSANNIGRDIYVNESNPGKQHNVVMQNPYIRLAPAASMDGADSSAYWLSETDGAKHTGEVYTKEKVDAAENPRYSAFTFNEKSESTAAVGSTYFESVGDAAAAVQRGDVSGTIRLLKTTRETVVIEEGTPIELDLNGCTIYGENSSVFTVMSGAKLSVTDSAGGGRIADGKGQSVPNGQTSSNQLSGGAFCVYGSLTASGITITGQKTKAGQAVYANGAEVKLTDCTIEKNYGSDCMIFLYNSSAELEGVTFDGNNGRGVWLTGGSAATVKNCTFKNNTSTGTAVHVAGGCRAELIDCTITDNNIGSNGALFVQGGYAKVTNTTISGNTGNAYGGILTHGELHLDNTVISDNTVTGRCGGLYAYSSGKVYMKDSSIYGNYASEANDIYLESNVYYCNESGTEADARLPENWGIGQMCFYEEKSNTYYVGDTSAYGSEIGTMPFLDKLNAQDRMTSTMYIKVTQPPSSDTQAAELVETGQTFPELKLAVREAVSRGEDSQIRLLKDVTENISITNCENTITLDLNGHVLTGDHRSRNVISLNKSYLTLKDSQGEGKITPPDKDTYDISNIRGMYINGGTFIMESGEFSGFDLRVGDSPSGRGAAICAVGGTAECPTKMFIKGGTFRDNANLSTSGYGAVFFQTKDGAENEFEISGGSFINNKSYYGGAVFYDATSAASQTLMTISGGLFEDNSAVLGGGAVYYQRNTNRTTSKDKAKIYGAKFLNNTAPTGGAVYLWGVDSQNEQFVMGDGDKRTAFEGNKADTAGAVYLYPHWDSGHKGIVFQNIEFSGNSSNGDCGAVSANIQKVEVRNCDFHDNVSKASYGAMYINGVNITVEDCDFYSNKNNTGGGALCVSGGSDGTKLLKNCRIFDNSTDGGTNVTGLYDSTAYTITYDSCEFYNNSAYSLRMESSSNVDKVKNIINCSFHDNPCGTIWCNDIRKATITLKNTTVENNNSNNAAVYVNSSSDANISKLIIDEGTVIRNNTALTGNGGGIYVSRTSLDIKGGEITGNKAPGNYGGGVYFSASRSPAVLTMSGGKIERNECLYGGGGIYAALYYGSEPTAYLNGGKISGNKAMGSSTNWGYGGGVMFAYTNISDTQMVKAVLNGVEITSNSARWGGGVYINNYVEEVTANGGTDISDNYATEAGGGVYIEYCRTKFILNGKRLFANHSMRGNDVFLNFNRSARSSSMELVKSSMMFDEGDPSRGVSWLDETTSLGYNDKVVIRPLNTTYQFTAIYAANTGTVVAVYNDTEYTSLQKAIDDVIASSTKSGTITLVNDTAESVSVGTGASITLNLNGRSLSGIGTSAITNRGSLVIIDDKQSVTVGEHEYPAVTSEGYITGTAGVAGGGVRVLSGTVKLKSGVIKDCTAGSNRDDANYGGGAAAISGGEFILDGGEIRNCTAYRGGAVSIQSVAGKFTMNSGLITGCGTTTSVDPNTRGYGGGIYNNGGSVSITGGTIQNCSAYYGGAVYNTGGSLTISGSVDESKRVVLTDNTAGRNGGAVAVRSGTFIVRNADITNNKTTYAMHASVSNTDLMQSAGGAVYHEEGNTIIGDGTYISGNYAVRGGAVYQLRGTVQIMGARTVITNNTAMMGGGCAQYPLPNVNNASMTLSDNASVYGNRSIRTAKGNDFYSAWEGSSTYLEALGNDSSRTPRLNLIPASSMSIASAGYNVWKNDAYSGSDRTGQSFTDGQYIKSDVLMCNDVQLTASHFNTTITPSLDSSFKFVEFKFFEDRVVDGKSVFDNGTSGLDNSAEKEKTAQDMLESGALEAEETYLYNGTEYNYIKYNGKLYERSQAVEWWPGNDSQNHNGIVRTFDRISYKFSVSHHATIDVEDLPDVSHCHVYFKMILPCSREDAEFTDLAATGLRNFSTIPGTDDDGNEIQTLTGYWEQNIARSDESGNFESGDIEIMVKGMKNGDVIKPSFECWFEGNNTDSHIKSEARAITVSAAPKYNGTLLNNEQLTYGGLFDTIGGVEVSEEHIGEPGVVSGVMLGYGVTVELYNDPAVKNILGIEFPKDMVEMDLSFNGMLYNDSGHALPGHAKKPIVWAYKENMNTDTGRRIGESANIINMDWADDDAMHKYTHYAHASAPFNSGSTSYSCYNGGSWTLQNSSSSDENEIKVHAVIDGFTCSSHNTTQNAVGVYSSILASNSVRAFSAGYIQIILPLDIDTAGLANGRYQIAANAAVSNFKAVSISGAQPDEVECASDLNTEERINKDLEYMNEYYHLSDLSELKAQYAKNERRYADNFISILRPIEISSGGNGNVIGKTNIFYDENMENINPINQSEDTGKGDTPINSVVYIRGAANFHSQSIDTSSGAYYMLDDSLYDSTVWNLIEYNYLTALNILQKFDADAYTPVGAPAVINEPKSRVASIVQDSFKISTSETEASWASNVTTNYDLTILYAAKKDGSNWNKKQLTDTSVTPNIAYDDGGSEDMDSYNEENLIYFKTLDDLHNYFDGNENAKCVAILYQFRNCCIRTGRSVETYARMNVTGEFDKVGNTFCTTNDVRGWLTYRPHYKVYYSQGTQKQHIYQFNWADEQHAFSSGKTKSGADADGLTVFGAGLNAGETYIGKLSYYTQDGEYPVTIDVNGSEEDEYVKTRYRNGLQVPGTHNGMSRGNTLLLYSLDTSIALNVATKVANTNTDKTEYKITDGERDVTFRITPKIMISSDAKKTELVGSGKLSTDVTVTLKIPEHLNYQPRSLRFDYSDPDCGYSEGGLEWTEEYDPASRTVTYKTFVSDIDLKLPMLLFDCKIGDENNPENDIKEHGLALTVEAEITAEYSSYNIFAAEAHTDTTTITVALSTQEGISLNIKEKTVEIGEDITFVLNYGNSGMAANENVQIFDILPHNEDGRGTDFTGGYRVKNVKVTFTDESDYEAFKGSGGDIRFINDDDMTWSSELTRAKLPREEYSPIETLENEVTDIVRSYPEYTFTAEAGYKDAERSVIYDFSECGLGSLRFNADGTINNAAPLLYGFIPSVQGNNRVRIEIVTSPNEYKPPVETDDQPAKLIESEGGEGSKNVPITQVGGNQYGNTFFFRRITDPSSDNPTYSLTSISNEVKAVTIDRVISGTVWMDQDQDGLYNTAEAVEYYNAQYGKTVMQLEYPIMNIEATLRYANERGEPDLTSTVKNVLGEEVKPVLTNEKGEYRFDNLAVGTYTVVFTEQAGTDYCYMKNSGIHPIEFNKLSATTDGNQLTVRGSKAKGEYDSGDKSKFINARLSQPIKLPDKTKIPGDTFSSPNWNLGLYYIDFEVQKQWGNMTNVDHVVDITQGTSIEFLIEGREQGSENLVYEFKLDVEKTADDIEAKFYRKQPDSSYTFIKNIPIKETPSGDSFIWSFDDETGESGICLQGRNEDNLISYKYSEGRVTVNGVDIKMYYTALDDTVVDGVSKEVTLNAVNDRILGSVTIVKKTGGGDVLEGAQFSLYRVDRAHDPSDDSFYTADSEPENLISSDPFDTRVSALQYKVILGDSAVLDMLKQSGSYYSYDNELTYGGKTYIVHKERYGGQERYYYYTDSTAALKYDYILGDIVTYNELLNDGTIDDNGKYEIGGVKYSVSQRIKDDAAEFYIPVTLRPSDYPQESVLEFHNLPMVDDQGQRIYYTIRETGVPEGYYALADFNSLTGIDLYNGGINKPHDFTYTVENTRQMQLPTTGGSGMRLLVVIGTMLVILGGLAAACVMMMRKRESGVKTEITP